MRFWNFAAMEERKVEEVLQDLREEIATVRNQLGITQAQMDDLWIARYLVQSNVQKAVRSPKQLKLKRKNEK